MKVIFNRISYLILLLICSFSLFSDPISSMDHDFNPALLSVRNRKTLEVGFNLEAGLYNNYFGLDNAFQEDLLLDLDDMNSVMGDNGLILASEMLFNSHAVLTVSKLSLGGYGGINMITSGNAPGDLFKILAEGITADDYLSDKSSLYSRVFYESGVYAGWRLDDIQIGVKMGRFVPLVYTDNAKINYSYSSSQADGSLSVTSNYSIPVYSYFDLDAVSEDSSTVATDLLSGSGAGFKLDLGAVKVKNNVAQYGVSLTGLALVPAKANYLNLYYGEITGKVSNIATNIEDEDELTQSDSSGDVVTSQVSKDIYTPIALGGFYRFDKLPLIDLIGEGELLFDDPFMFSMIMDIEGSVWPLSWLSTSFGWDKIAWKSGVGLRINLWLMEIGAEVGLASPDIRTLFTKTGATAGVFFALGF